MENKLKITVEGVSYEVLVEDITGTETKEKKPRKPIRKVTYTEHNLQPESDVERFSPLNGVVVDIMVEEGQRVEKGAALIAIEAMKIINTLTAHRRGVVTQIAVEKDQSVFLGQTLLSIQ
ncbi:MAG: acetyl-CoA carboxylase biotin carboxyl carrier protein subunit [Magnetococcales bacterium]|nr:acetyl-CoA carboxylase biotin carboxyl carrier protein subunit [Magnetococcales bacterium]